MRIAAVIMECNPFHDGHSLILRKARELTSAEYVIVVMSGDFVQRGEPAIIPKEVRVKDILQHGADLVLELPLPYALGAADYFARGAVTLLSRLHVVTDLVFGSGSGDLAYLSEIADILTARTPVLEECLQKNLGCGLSYPAARSAALKAVSGLSMPEDSNDLLAIEYLKAYKILAASKEIFPSIQPYAMQRTTQDNASNLRKIIRQQDPAAMSADAFSEALLYKLSSLLWNGQLGHLLTDYVDISQELANRIMAQLWHYQSATSFILQVKSRNYTYTRVSRSLMHILLDIRKDDMQSYESAGTIGYARVLGFRKSSGRLLSLLQEHASIPIITRLPEYVSSASPLEPPFNIMLLRDIQASEMYDLFYAQRAAKASAGTVCSKKVVPELSKKMVII